MHLRSMILVPRAPHEKSPQERSDKYPLRVEFEGETCLQAWSVIAWSDRLSITFLDLARVTRSTPASTAARNAVLS